MTCHESICTWWFSTDYLKVEVFTVLSSNGNCPYAYFISTNEYNTSPSVPSIFSAIMSIKFSRFGIWYLSSAIELFNGRASKARFTDRSFFTVITTGCMKTMSLLFFTLWICPCSSRFWISLSTCSSAVSEISAPFAVLRVCRPSFLYFYNCSLYRVSWIDSETLQLLRVAT